MNILKTTPKGVVIETKIGINPELSEKLSNCGSYHMKAIKKQCDKIASWEIVDNDIVKNEDFPKMVKVTSVPFNEVDADCVSAFVKTQENLVETVLKAESMSLMTNRAVNCVNRVFKAMLDTSFTPDMYAEN